MNAVMARSLLRCAKQDSIAPDKTGMRLSKINGYSHEKNKPEVFAALPASSAEALA